MFGSCFAEPREGGCGAVRDAGAFIDVRMDAAVALVTGRWYCNPLSAKCQRVSLSSPCRRGWASWLGIASAARRQGPLLILVKEGDKWVYVNASALRVLEGASPRVGRGGGGGVRTGLGSPRCVTLVLTGVMFAELVFSSSFCRCSLFCCVVDSKWFVFLSFATLNVEI